MKLAMVFVFGFLAFHNVVWGATSADVRIELDKLLRIAANESIVVNQALNSSSQIVQQIETEVISNGSRNVSNEFDRLNSEFNQIVQSAEKLNVNISKCTQNQYKILEDLHQHSALEVLTCAKGFSNQAQETLSKGLADVADLIDKAFNYESRLAECQANSACLDKILAGISYDKLDIPRRMHQVLHNADIQADASKLRLLQCAVVPTESFIQNGGRIIEGIQNCANQIIEGTTRAPL